VFGISAGSNLKPGEEKKTEWLREEKKAGMVILTGIKLSAERKKPGKPLRQNQGAGSFQKGLTESQTRSFPLVL
jgi:hypothetical protein